MQAPWSGLHMALFSTAHTSWPLYTYLYKHLTAWMVATTFVPMWQVNTSGMVWYSTFVVHQHISGNMFLQTIVYTCYKWLVPVSICVRASWHLWRRCIALSCNNLCISCNTYTPCKTCNHCEACISCKNSLFNPCNLTYTQFQAMSTMVSNIGKVYFQ